MTTAPALENGPRPAPQYKCGLGRIGTVSGMSVDGKAQKRLLIPGHRSMALSHPPAGALLVRVYYEDTDFSGRVYHASYLRFLERGRTEWLRGRGFAHRELAETSGVAFAVRSLQIEFLAPALMDDLLRVRNQRRQGPRSLDRVSAADPARRQRAGYRHGARCGDSRRPSGADSRFPARSPQSASVIDGTRAPRIELFPFDQAVDTISIANY